MSSSSSVAPIDIDPRSLVEESVRKYIKVKERVIDADWKVVNFQVHSTNPKTGKICDARGGTEDETFIRFPSLCVISRAYSKLYYKGMFIAEVRGPRKFFGTTEWDEDEYETAEEEGSGNNESRGQIKENNNNNNNEKDDAFIDKQQIRQWQEARELQVEFQEKANGKLFIMTLFRHPANATELWLFGGSKNVHVPMPLGVPYSGKDKHILHYQMMNKAQELFRSTSAKETLLGRSLVGEYVDGKHMIWTDQPYLVFFSLDTTPPGAGSEFASVRELAPRQATVPTQEQLDRLRNLEDTEGVVIVYRNTRTSQLFREKHKTKAYVLMRTVRETICHSHKDRHTLESVIGRVKRKVEARGGPSFLKLSPDEMSMWKERMSDFCRFIFTSPRYDFCDVDMNRNGMAVVWRVFTRPDTVVIDTTSATLSPSSITPPTYREILSEPWLFDAVVSLVRHEIPVVVILSGIPGSGKTTVTAQLTALFSDKLASFSTDRFFVGGDGVYRHDVSKLGEYHARNLRDFCASTAPIKVVDNTNLKHWEYEKYTQHAQDHGYVILVLSTKFPSSEAEILTLSRRNVHGVGPSHLRTMLSKYEPPSPVFYAVFFPRQPICDLVGPDVVAVQPKPLHITVHFVGSARAKPKANAPPLRLLDIHAKAGTVVSVKAVGVTTSSAGSCLVFDKPSVDTLAALCEGETQGRASVPHVTLSVKAGSTSKQVGERITDATSTTIPLKDPVFLTGVFCPTY